MFGKVPYDALEGIGYDSPHRDRAGSVRQLDHHAALPRRQHGLLVWEILDWFMAVAVAMALPVNFAHKISLRKDEPDGLLIRRSTWKPISRFTPGASAHQLVLLDNWFHALLAGERVRAFGHVATERSTSNGCGARDGCSPTRYIFLVCDATGGSCTWLLPDTAAPGGRLTPRSACPGCTSRTTPERSPSGRDRHMGVHQPATSSWFATPPACTCCQTRRATDPPVRMWPVAPAGPRRLRRPPYHARKLRAPPAPIRL